MADWHSALGGFPRASHRVEPGSDMQRRSESTFVLPDDVVHALLSALRPDFAVLPAGDALVAHARALYFDTDDLALFQAHQRGSGVRYEARIRHDAYRELSVLEIKCWHGEHDTVTVRRLRAYGNSTFGPADAELVRRHCGTTGELRPQAWIAYRRISLLSVRSADRVTIDTDIDVWRAASHARLRRAAVVVVKQPQLDLLSPAMHVLQSAGHRAVAMSPYRAAIAVTSPDVRGRGLCDSPLADSSAVERGRAWAPGFADR